MMHHFSIPCHVVVAGGEVKLHLQEVSGGEFSSRDCDG